MKENFFSKRSKEERMHLQRVKEKKKRRRGGVLTSVHKDQNCAMQRKKSK